DGSRLIQRGIVVGSAVGCGVEGGQAVGDVIDGGGQLQMRRYLVLSVHIEVGERRDVAVRVRIGQLNAGRAVGGIDAVHVAAIVESGADDHGLVRPLEREGAAGARRAGRTAQRGGP